MNKFSRVIPIIRFYFAASFIVIFIRILFNQSIPDDNVAFYILSFLIGLIIPISFIAYLINTGINEFKNRESNSKWLTIFGIVYEVGACILMVYFFNLTQNIPFSAKILLIVNASVLIILTVNDVYRNFKGLFS